MSCLPVYCVDDNAAFAEQLARTLKRNGCETLVFHSGCDFISRLKELAFGCVLLDVRMPSVSGPDVLDRIALLSPAWPVIMMSGQCSVDETIRSFRTGAVDLLQKPFTIEQLKGALAEAVKIGETRLIEEQRKYRASQIKLSRRERQILEGLSQGKQSKQIAWELGISIRTADLHRSRLFTKLGVNNAPAALATGFELGLLAPGREKLCLISQLMCELEVHLPQTSLAAEN